MRHSFLLSAAAIALFAAATPALAQTEGQSNADKIDCALFGCNETVAVPESEQEPVAAPVVGTPTGRPGRYVAATKGRGLGLATGGGGSITTAGRSTGAAVSRPRPNPIVRYRPPAGKADLQIGFELNSAVLTSDGLRVARDFLEVLQRPSANGKRFLIAGHTDSLGSRARNRELSTRRAQALADYLSAAGVDASRFEVRGYGPDMPMKGHRPSDPANRRVEVRVR